MRDVIHFGTKQIDFHLIFTDRKSLGISVKPDLTVYVRAPFDSSIERIKEKLRNKAAWIIRQQSYFLSFHPKLPVRKFISGETHLYMGRQYRLKIIQGKDESVKLKGQYIVVSTSDKTRAKVLVTNWYLSHAKNKLHSITQPLIEKFKKYNIEPTSIVLREMSMRWGSCTPKGKVILNPELIKAPKGCIEYVIIHELCHLIHHDHTRKFIELQTKEMPNWEKWKMKLENLLA